MMRRRFLTALLALMILMMAALAGIFILMRSADQAPAAVQSPGMKHIRSIYGWGDKPEELFQQPFNIVWRNGSLYMSDKGLSQVLRLTPEGQLQARYGTKGRKPEEIWAPTGLEVDTAGNVYVPDGGHKKIVVYGPDGSFVRQASFEESPLATLITGNRMFLTTAGSVKALQLPDLTELASWGSRGRGETQFDYPNGLAFDPGSGLLFVADGNNLRVKALDQQGNTVWIYGHPAEDMNDTNTLFGLAGSAEFAEGYLFVTDPLDSVIHILDTKGNEVAQLGDAGPEDGLFQYPAGIAYMGNNRFAIAEWGNKRIQIVEIDVEGAIDEWKRNKPDRSEGAPTSETTVPGQGSTDTTAASDGTSDGTATPDATTATTG